MGFFFKQLFGVWDYFGLPGLPAVLLYLRDFAMH